MITRGSRIFLTGRFSGGAGLNTDAPRSLMTGRSFFSSSGLVLRTRSGGRIVCPNGRRTTDDEPAGGADGLSCRTEGAAGAEGTTRRFSGAEPTGGRRTGPDVRDGEMITGCCGLTRGGTMAMSPAGARLVSAKGFSLIVTGKRLPVPKDWRSTTTTAL